MFTIKYSNELEDPKFEKLNQNRIIIHGDDPLSKQKAIAEAISHNNLVRTRATKIKEKSFEDDLDKLDAILEIGQQIVSGDQFLEQAEAKLYENCDQLADLGGTTCLIDREHK